MIWKSAKVVWNRASRVGVPGFSGLGLVGIDLDLPVQSWVVPLEKFGNGLRGYVYRAGVVWDWA